MIAMYSFSGNAFSLNIFFTLFFGLLAIFIYDKVMSLEVSKLFRYFFGFMSVLFIGYIAQSFRFDYGFWGILVIFMFYFFRDNKMLSTIAFCASCIIKFEIQMLINGYDYRYVLLCLFTMLPIIFINSYNKKQGHKIKYFLYIFYPAHLLILYLIFR